MNNDTNLANVKLSTVKSMLIELEKFCENSKLDYNECEVSFEFLIGSLYPQVYQNILNTIKDSYSLGYVVGINSIIKEMENENADKTNS